MMNIACDDGSTNVKLAWIENGEIKTHVSQNAFREGWATPLAFGGKTIYNYLIDGRKFTHDIGSTSAITTTHTSFQFDAVSRVAIHHALLTSGLEPQDVELTVTLPVAMFFTSDAQLNEANIEKKKANVMGPITLNNGETFQIIDTRVTSQYAAGHLPTAQNIPHQELRSKLTQLDPTRPVITYCNKGITGNATQNILLNHNFKTVYNLSGGFQFYDATQED